MKTETRTWLYFLKIVLIPGIVFLIVAMLMKSCTDLDHKAQERIELSKIINNSVGEYAKSNLLLPEFVFLNIGGGDTEMLKDSITAKIVSALTQQYLHGDTGRISDIGLEPFFLTGKTKDTFLFTSEMHENLTRHLNFLSKQVDAEVARAKEEVDRDINRLNTWVTLWMSFIAFLGIFIPLFINYEIKATADKALLNADEAISKTTGITEKVADAEKKVGEATVLAEQTATKADKLMLVTNAIGNLRNLDENTIKLISNPKKVLAISLRSIYNELIECDSQLLDHKIVRDCFRQLATKLQMLSFNDAYQEYMPQMNELAVSISKALKSSINEESADKLLVQLIGFINAINTGDSQ